MNSTNLSFGITVLLILSFPLVGNPSDSPLEKGVRGLFFRKIPDKPE
jgi:hypothetical protein